MWISRLLNKGAKVSSKDTSGQTASHYACAGGSLECVKLLLDYGANISEKDRFFHPLLPSGCSLLHSAHSRLLAFRNGETALFKASLKGHLDILRLLIERTEDKSQTHGVRVASSQLMAQQSPAHNWETITLLVEPKEGLEESNTKRDPADAKKSEGDLTSSLSAKPMSSGVIDAGHGKRHVLDVLVILMKHGKQRSAFQLISTEGSVKSSSLVLEREEDNDDSDSDAGLMASHGCGDATYSEMLASSTPSSPTTANLESSKDHREKEKDKKKDKKSKKSKKEKEDPKKTTKKDSGKGVHTTTDALVEVIG